MANYSILFTSSADHKHDIVVVLPNKQAAAQFKHLCSVRFGGQWAQLIEIGSLTSAIMTAHMLTDLDKVQYMHIKPSKIIAKLNKLPDADPKGYYQLDGDRMRFAAYPF